MIKPETFANETSHFKTQEVPQKTQVCGVVTAEILFFLPDYPNLLQTYVYQLHDCAPEYPRLKKFLAFWQQKLDGQVYSVEVTSPVRQKTFHFAGSKLLH